MKKIFGLVIACILSTYFVQAQTNTQFNLVDIVKTIRDDPDAIKAAINSAVKDTALLNTTWQYLISQEIISDSASKWRFFKDLNIKFKTFQSKDSMKASIGFSYDFNASFAKFKERENSKISHAFNATAQGNVAFNKNVNPANFLVDKVDYSFSHFLGGVRNVTDTPSLLLQRDLRRRLTTFDDPLSREAMKKWDSLGAIVTYRNMYSYTLAPTFSFESNQDFSRTQFVPGINIRAGAKAWNDKNVLAKLNVFDYPFALIRYLTGVDKSVTPYGATIPVISFGVDYVIPQDDTIRKVLVGDTNPYQRVRFEAGYRSLVTRIKKEIIFFDMNYRFYYELNAPKPVVSAGIDQYSYLVLALQSTSGMFVSYSAGKLPFDQKNQQVYSIGFNYKF